jgi:hypothetical protein
MQAVKTDHPAAPGKSSNKFIYIGFILVILLVVAIYVNNTYRAFQPASLPEDTVSISQGVLEEKYGLHVNLVAVTAAGGLVDLRLKVLDGEKAKLLLADEKNFPSLFLENGMILNAPADIKSQKIEFTSGGIIFIIYPNSGNVVKPGSPVTIILGETALEPINVR